MAVPSEEHALTPLVVAIVEGQNWTSTKLTDEERVLVDLTVRATASLIEVGGMEREEKT